jgi:hypothetical protein
VAIIIETRYGGVYEGGPWAAFGVSDPRLVPGEAFSGDPLAFEWWDSPTVPVGVGDSPNDSLERLKALVARDRAKSEAGLFTVGERVAIAQCAPDDWRASDTAAVESVEYRHAQPRTGGLRGQCLYSLRFTDATIIVVPERYLRRAMH